MTTYALTLADGRTTTIDADELTTRQDGSLWLLRAAAPPPDKLVPVAVFARGDWSCAVRADAEIVWQERPTPMPRFA